MTLVQCARAARKRRMADARFLTSAASRRN
jgi:hypothetical protein